MQVTKLRTSAAANGLVPAGVYFATLSRKLKDANTRGHAMRARLHQEDRELEALFRRSSASRLKAHARAEMHG